MSVQSSRDKETKAMATAQDLLNQTRTLAERVRDSYWELGEVLEVIAHEKAFKTLGHTTFKAFVEAEVDVIQGPSAEALRRINRFFAQEVKVAMQDRKEDYEKLLQACRKVSSQKLQQLASREGLDVISRAFGDHPSERRDGSSQNELANELLGNLENLPTKAFKKEWDAMKVGAGIGSKKGSAKEQIAPGGTEEETVLEAKVVRKVFKIPKAQAVIVEEALARARVGAHVGLGAGAHANAMGPGGSSISKDAEAIAEVSALAEVCRAYAHAESDGRTHTATLTILEQGMSESLKSLSTGDEQKLTQMLSQAQLLLDEVDVEIHAVCRRTGRMLFGNAHLNSIQNILDDGKQDAGLET